MTTSYAVSLQIIKIHKPKIPTFQHSNTSDNGKQRSVVASPDPASIDLNDGANSDAPLNGSLQKASSTNGPKRVTSLGNKRMSVTDEILPELCRRIGVQGTNKRMEIINQFALDYPDASVRQVTIKFGELTVKARPPCVHERPIEKIKRKGKSAQFYLRPMMYRLLPAEEQPQCDWNIYAEEDEKVWQKEKELEAEKQRKIKKEQHQNKKRKNAAKDTKNVSESNGISQSVTESVTASIVAEPLHSDDDDQHYPKKIKVS